MGQKAQNRQFCATRPARTCHRHSVNIRQGRYGLSVSTACGFVTLRARELCAGLRWKIRRVLAGSCRPRCPAGPAELPLSESNRRTAAFRRWRHCADDLGCPAFAVPAADLGDRGHVRSVVCGAPCSRGACRRSCSRRGRPSTGRAPPKAAKRSQVTDRGTPTTSPITAAAVFLPLEHRSAFPTCAVQRALGHSNRS
jgi:hypothetical protein